MKSTFIACLVIFTLFGCKEFHEINTSMKDGILQFNNEDITRYCKESLLIYDFEIIYFDKDNSRLAWSITRKSQPKRDLHSFEFPIIYGINLDFMVLKKQPMRISPGKYNVGAEVSCDDNSYSLLGSFQIDDSGNLVVNESNNSN